MPELRKDIVTREWVVLSKERAKRPTDFRKKGPVQPTLQFDANCPFCSGNEFQTPPELLAYRKRETRPNTPGWRVRVTSNKFAALDREGELNRKDVDIYDVMNGVGAHEVVIETPDHGKTIPHMEEKEVEEIIWAYCDRYNFLREDRRLKYILVFKNYGEEAGCSLVHPHSQIVATPVIPQKVWSKIKGVEQYREYRNKCVYCHVAEHEIKSGERLIAENGGFIACAPFASRSPFETWIIPKTHRACFARMSRFEVAEFAQILRETMLRLYLCLSNPPYNYTLLTATCDSDTLDNFHWHLEIVPRLTTPAGFELGTSIYINTVPPEDAARHLREVEIPKAMTLTKPLLSTS
ncbi:MAG: galactose-1-phosphate uridylyltransferase [candidate division Zixibacteria bacterium]|nr:galactose-1-phosphate uridylyltransferase [candidate division Zixibacteria bacterium]